MSLRSSWMYGKLFPLLSWYFLCFETHYKYLLMQHFIKQHNACFASYSLDISNNFCYYNNISHYRKIQGYLNISFASSLLLPAPPTLHCSCFQLCHGVLVWLRAISESLCFAPFKYWVMCDLVTWKWRKDAANSLQHLEKSTTQNAHQIEKPYQALAKAFVISSGFSFNVWGHMALHILCS